MVITTNPLIKSDMISVTLTAGSNQTKIPFPDQPQLRSVFLQSIYFPYIAVDYYNQPTLNEDFSYVGKSFLTLYFEGKENVQQIPLVELVSDTQVGNVYNLNGALGFFNQQIVWPKCYITMAVPNPPGVDSVFTFVVHYSLQKI
jgi:hypothetical protein